MTELYIDGTCAVLSKDFNIQVKRENPLFTKNGEYTYDITLPLGNAVNSTLFGHLNRLNKADALSTNRQAVLVADNRVYCRGTEVITGWTEDTVSIQIASGNSELNWVIGADLQISFLDNMPVIPAFTVQGVRDQLEKNYPMADYALFSVYDNSTGTIINQWWRDFRDPNPGLYPYQGGLKTPRDFYPMPFLCQYINQLLRALGYTLTYNYLHESVYNTLCICHTVRTMKWCEMLPGWSVSDFLTQIEQLFNVTVLVDNEKREARIVSNAAFYAGATTAHVAYVEDAYEVESADEDDDAAVQMGNCDVTYSFPDTTYFRTSRLAESVKTGAPRETVPADFAPQLGVCERLDEWFAEAENRKADTLYTDALSGRMAFFREMVKNELAEEQYPNWTFCDEFADVKRDDPEQTVELEMMPAEMGQVEVEECFIDIVGDQSVWSSRMVAMPIIGESGSATEEETEKPTTVAEMIEAGETDSGTSKGIIYLAFYGEVNLPVYNYGNNPMLFPMAYTDEFIEVRRFLEALHERTNSVGRTLRPCDLDTNLWQGGYDIDFDHAVKLTCHDPNLYDARYIFEIRNKRYVCREMEFTLDANGRKGAWSGTFYPIKLSDTEADARWILTDGRWRDGGVWLDNGRWLDDPT